LQKAAVAVAAVRVVVIIEVVVRAVRVIVVDRAVVRVVMVIAVDRVMARVARAVVKVVRVTVREVRVEDKVVRAKARVMVKARVVVPIKVTLNSIAIKTSIVMAMVVARDKAVSHSIDRDLLSRLHNKALGCKPLSSKRQKRKRQAKCLPFF